MTRQATTLLVVAMVATIMMTGCAPKKMDIEAFKAEMAPQMERHPALDQLDAFVGNWVGKSEGTSPMVEGVMAGSGTSEISWDPSGRILIERGTYKMCQGDDAPTMSMVMVWTYDPKDDAFRFVSADSMGNTSTGKAEFDEATQRWVMKERGQGPCGTTRSKGSCTFTDGNAMEWSFTKRGGPFGWFKFMDMTGTSTKQ